MNIEELRDFCIARKGVTEEFPFDFDTLVFKVLGKIFALTSLSQWEKGDMTINLKCNPEKAIELRENYESIIAGYHMSKKHWNTVNVNSGDVSHDFIKELINHSYDLVVSGLTKKIRQDLENL
jgi:predicted DNA-binding protein (MmcQ/YjbR family)